MHRRVPKIASVTVVHVQCVTGWYTYESKFLLYNFINSASTLVNVLTTHHYNRLFLDVDIYLTTCSHNIQCVTVLYLILIIPMSLLQVHKNLISVAFIKSLQHHTSVLTVILLSVMVALLLDTHLRRCSQK